MAKITFKGRFITVEERNVNMKGKKLVFERVLSTDVAVILPFLDDETVVMEKNYRPAIGKYLLELPAGAVDEGESPKEAAGRELEEETGYAAGKLEFLFRAYLSPGSSNCDAYFFRATKLRKTKQRLEEGEMLEVKPMRLTALLKMIKHKEIEDAKTIAGILYHAHTSRSP